MCKNLHPFNLQSNIMMPVTKTFRQFDTNSHVQWTIKTCIKPNCFPVNRKCRNYGTESQGLPGIGDALAADLGRPHYTTRPKCSARPPPGIMHCYLPPTAGKAPDRPGLATSIFLTARPMRGPPDDDKAQSNGKPASYMSGLQYVMCGDARFHARCRHVGRFASIAYIYRVCAESGECLGLPPAKRKHMA